MSAALRWIGHAVKRFFTAEGVLARLLVAGACLAVLGMYCTNDDMGGDPHSLRGDGVYRPVLARGDGHMMYLMARSTALDLDWRFDNDLARFGDPWRQAVSPTGRKVIPHPVGPPLIWTPLIWVAEAGAVVANVFGADVPLHGYTLWHQRFVFLASVIAACAAVLLGRKLAMRAIGGQWSASYAMAAVLLGTSLTYYATYMPSYGHAFDAGACAAFLGYWASSIGDSRRRRWVVLGVTLGIAMLIRVQDVALGIVVVIEAAVEVGKARERKTAIAWLLRGSLVLLIALAVFTPQLLYWKLTYGEFFANPQGSRYTRFGSPMVLELLFSARNGWFSTTPIAYAGVIGLFCLPKRARLLAAGLLGAVIVQVYLNSTIMDWWGMASFGSRRLCSMTMPLVVGLAALTWRIARLARRAPRVVKHGAVILVFGVFVAWNLRDVRRLRHGVAAPTEIIPTCCNHVPRWARGPIRWAFDHIGNPFEFPANAIFALRHDVPIQRWDTIVGTYPIVPPADALKSDALWRQRATFAIGAPGGEPYLVRGWSGSILGVKRYRWTTESAAIALVPNLMPCRQRMTLWVAAGGADTVELRWDGEVVAQRSLMAGWNAIEFEQDVSVGEHELEVRAPVSELRADATLPAPSAGRAGVAVGDLQIRLVGD